MDKIDQILKAARERAREKNLPYQGALLPAEAFALMKEVSKVRLVDVRSRAEWELVGRVPGSVEIEWATYPGMQRNPAFTHELQQKVERDAIVMFLCRSGARSHAAASAAAEAGYSSCYNILEGFEGDKDEAGHRGRVGGWKAAGLPWTQG